MKLTAALLFPLTVILLLSGCAAEIGLVKKTDIEPLQEELRQTKLELEELKKSVEEIKSATAGEGALSAIRESQSTLYAQGAELLKEAQILSGRFEEYKFFIDRSLKETSAELEIMRSKVSGFSKQLEGYDMEPLKKKLSELEESLNNLIGRLSALETMSQKEAAGTAPAVANAPSAEKSYEDALKAYNEKRYADSKQMFEAFLKDNPGHKLAGNAYFWLGETYYAEKDYENAIVAYQEVVEKYKGGPKVPPAMLKQAYAFIELNDKKAAKALLGELVEKFPVSEQAAAAKKKLASLK